MVMVTKIGLVILGRGMKMMSLILVARHNLKDVEEMLGQEVLILFVPEFLLTAVWKSSKINSKMTLFP